MPIITSITKTKDSVTLPDEFRTIIKGVLSRRARPHRRGAETTASRRAARAKGTVRGLRNQGTPSRSVGRRPLMTAIKQGRAKQGGAEQSGAKQGGTKQGGAEQGRGRAEQLQCREGLPVPTRSLARPWLTRDAAIWGGWIIE